MSRFVPPTGKSIHLALGPERHFHLEVCREGQPVVIALSRRLDLATSPRIEEELNWPSPLTPRLDR